MDLDHRNLSYSMIAETKFGKAVIRVVENLSGRPAVLWRLSKLPALLADETPIWDAVWTLFGMTLNHSGPDLPRDGPALIISNHPFGLADSLALCKLLSETGRPFHIVANEIFLHAPQISDSILPISFAAGRAVARDNLATRKAALNILKQGGVVALFPSGATAAPVKPFGPPREVAWSSFAARLAIESGAPVVPVYFQPRKRVIFDNVGLLHPTLRFALQINGFYQSMDRALNVYTGPAMQLDHQTAELATATMRETLLSLGPEKIDPSEEGRRF